MNKKEETDWVRIEQEEQRRISIAKQLSSIQKEFFESRKGKDDFIVKIIPYIRGNDEASCAVVERTQIDTEDECQYKLKREEIKAFLETIRNINPLLEEVGFPLKKISLEYCTLPLQGEQIEELALFVEANPNIDSFNLRFVCKPEHAEQCISNLAKVIDSCRNLELLHLDGIECEGITNVCLQKMGKMTQKLENLQTFVFKLRQSQYIDEKGIIDFGNDLSCSSTLVRFEMSFYYFMNAFSNASMVALSRAISKSLSLESLSLEFFWCSDITDNAAEIIVNSINNMPNLKSLIINFSGSTLLTNQTLESIGQAIFRNNQIEKLTLEFGNCELFTDQGLLELSTKIGACSRIQELTTDFSSCFGVTDAGIEHICMILPELPMLQDLFIQTHEFISSQTQELVDELMEQVKLFNKQSTGLGLSLHVMNKYSSFLKRKEVFNDIVD